jgi:hypothetical protein
LGGLLPEVSLSLAVDMFVDNLGSDAIDLIAVFSAPGFEDFMPRTTRSRKSTPML